MRRVNSRAPDVVTSLAQLSETSGGTLEAIHATFKLREISEDTLRKALSDLESLSIVERGSMRDVGDKSGIFPEVKWEFNVDTTGDRYRLKKDIREQWRTEILRIKR